MIVIITTIELLHVNVHKNMESAGSKIDQNTEADLNYISFHANNDNKNELHSSDTEKKFEHKIRKIWKEFLMWKTIENCSMTTDYCYGQVSFLLSLQCRGLE